jgi:hypothetical protein
LIRRYVCLLLLFLLWTSSALAETPGNSGEIRERIEREYGIRVLLPDECAAVLLPDGKEYGPYTPGALSPIARYAAADPASGPLTLLEETLALYPDGFFIRFTDQGGSLKILLAESIVMPEHPENTCLGDAFLSGDDYMVCLSLSGFRTDVVHHELWHAIEWRILAGHPEAFCAEEWMKLNPEGFRYTPLYAGSHPAASLPEAADGWFVSEYSRTAPGEDRAALWALRFTVPDPLWWEEHLRLKAKLDVMEAEMQRIFGNIQ